MPPFLGIIDSGTRNLLTSLAGVAEPSWAGASNNVNHAAHASEPEPFPIEGWGLFEANEETDLAMSAEQQGIALIARSLLDRFDELSVGSADDDAERSVVDEDEVPEPALAGKHPFYLRSGTVIIFDR